LAISAAAVDRLRVLLKRAFRDFGHSPSAASRAKIRSALIMLSALTRARATSADSEL
jgi:hypothetical protein